MNENRIGDWICTYSGIDFYPLDPQPVKINIVDVAHALSMLCRFGGHTSQFYSVAEHCVRGTAALRSQGASKIVQRAFLLHDASEAYLVDVPRPIKTSLVGYIEIEKTLQAIIEAKFGVEVSEEERALVKHMDEVMLATEKRDLMPSLSKDWGPLPEPLPGLIWSMTPDQAESAFLSEWALVRRD